MNTKDKIKDLISIHSGIKRESISDSDFIEETLGITGDDAWDVIEAFQNEYKIDISDFEFSLHFSHEVGSNSHKDYGYYPISILHLALVVNTGFWFLPNRDEINFKAVKLRIRRGKIFKIFAVICLLLVFYLFDDVSSLYCT